jgi:hypothetical protein
VAISEIEGREDHEGVWHAVTDDESAPTDLTAVCGVEIAADARAAAWDGLDESAATCEDCHELLEGEHREAGFTVENIGGVPVVRSTDEPPWR